MPTQFAYDTFRGVDNLALSNKPARDGGTWTRHTSSTTNDFIISQNRLMHNATGWELAYHSATPPSADYAVQYLGYMWTNIGHQCVAGRIDTTNANFYYAGHVSGNDFDFGKCINGTFTQLGSGGVTIGSGQSHNCRLIMSGTFISVFGNGSSGDTRGQLHHASTVDSDITSAGLAGVYSSSIVSPTSGVHLETWKAEGLEAWDIRGFTISNGVAGTTATGSLPNGTVDNDLLVATIRSVTGTITAVPSGWTLALDTPLTATAGYIRTYYKIASSEPSSWDWTLSTTTDWSISVHAYRNLPNAILTARTTTYLTWGTNANYPLSPHSAERSKELIHCVWADQNAPTVSPGTGGPPPKMLVRRSDVTPFMYTAWYHQTPADGSVEPSMSRGGASSNAAGQLLAFGLSTESSNIPTLVGYTELGLTGRTLDVPVPTGVQDDDLLIAVFHLTSGTNTIVDPSGWTMFHSDTFGGQQRFYYRIANNEPATHTWGTDPVSGFMMVQMRAYRGVDTENPLNGSVTTNAASSINPIIPSITTTRPNTRIVGFATHSGNRTLMASEMDSSLITSTRLFGGDMGQAAWGTTPAVHYTVNSSDSWKSHAFAINPAPTHEYAQPVSDTSTGAWANELGSTTNLYQSIDESFPSTTDYIQSGSNPTDDTVRFKVATKPDPNVSNGYQITYGYYRPSGVSAINMRVRLVQGASTEIASWTHIDIPTTYTEVTQTLTTSQADAITDHSDLYVEFVADMPTLPALRNASSFPATAAQTSLTLNRPTGTTDGDLLVAVINLASLSTITAPSGWVLVHDTQHSSGAGHVSTYYKVASSEPASWSWTFASSTCDGWVGAYTGIKASDPFDASAHSHNLNAVSTITAPSIATTAANALLIGVFVGGGARTGAPSAPMVERHEDSNGPFLLVADEVFAPIGATGTRTVTPSAAINAGAQLIAFSAANV